MSRARIVVIALAIAAGLLGAFLLSGERASPAAGADAGRVLANPEAPDRTEVLSVVPERPRLVTAEQTSGPQFDDEPRNRGWASQMEPRISVVVGEALTRHALAGAVRIGEVDCRTSRCQFALHLQQGDRIDDVLVALEDPVGLPTLAASMLLSNLQRTPEGSPARALVTLRFAGSNASGAGN